LTPPPAHRSTLAIPVVPPSSCLALSTAQEDMSLNDLLDSLFAEIAAPNNDEELFERYLNLSGYDYDYNQKNDPEPSNPPTSFIPPPLPSAPLAQGALHYSAPVTPCNNVLVSCGATPVRRPTGLRTNGAYWNIQTGMCTPGVDRGLSCTIGHGCMPMVSPSPQ
jgi:hypothetical protein